MFMFENQDLQIRKFRSKLLVKAMINTEEEQKGHIYVLSIIDFRSHEKAKILISPYIYMIRHTKMSKNI
jgi:hypothetical protein